VVAGASLEEGTERLVTPRFAVITLSALCYFTAFSMLLPTLPRYVEDVLNGSGAEVGIVVGAFGVSAAIVRPFLGRLGDRYGRRLLLVGGAALTGISVVLYPVWLSIPALVALRVFSGIGESGAFVGAATATQDLASDDRRGEASSYFSLAIYIGLGLGPFLGEFINERSDFETVCRVALLLSLTSALLAFATPAKPPVVEGADRLPRSRAFLHRAAVLPGLLLTLSLIGFVGYTTFLALYLDDLGDGSASAGSVFLFYAAIVIVIRLTLADLPDRLGPRKGSTLAFAFIGTGLAIVAAWPAIAGVYVGTAVLACGVAFNYPALFLLVMAETEPHERSHSVASFGFFFDIAGALGAPLLGVVIDLSGSERPAFALGSATALVALVGVRRLTRPENHAGGARNGYGQST
jgi:MFS family permease